MAETGSEEPVKRLEDKSPTEVGLENNILKQLPVVEEIARFRYEFSLGLVDSPKSEWEKVYNDLLGKYPKIAVYKEVFDDIFDAVKTDVRRMDRFWENYEPASESKKNSTTTKRIEIASPEISKRMIEDLCQKSLKGKVRAEKDVTVLRFFVDEEDFESLATIRNTDGVVLEGAFTVQGASFPYIVLRNYSYQESMYILQHEYEHLQDRFLGSRFYLFKYPMKMSSMLADRLRRRTDDPFSLDSSLKGELLAYFSSMELGQPPNPKNVEHRSKILPEFKNYILETLTDDSENGVYYPEYKRRFDNIDREDYVKNTNRGINAFANLFHLYEEEVKKGMQIDSIRMTINVLEQFPLKSWSAVTKLLIARHHSKSTD